MGRISTGAIPDIYITRIHNPQDPDCEVHCESFSRLAEIFGRNTGAHRHSRFYQVHLLHQGSIRLHLDEGVHAGQAPLVFLTPPAVPHAFHSDDQTEGWVISVRQEVVRGWRSEMTGQVPGDWLRRPAFLLLGDGTGALSDEGRRLMDFGRLLQGEFRGAGLGRSALLKALALCFFTSLGRLLASRTVSSVESRRSGEDLRIFLGFCDLVEARFQEHLALRQYARLLRVTESRLNDVCRRVASLASKELVHERLLAEARRLLRFSLIPVSELGYRLGFADPGYFSRFFKQRAGCSPSEFRQQHQAEALKSTSALG
ncbi:MAG: helix-turn-helix domain-containing protein [Steroidobacteraceae bacterium]